LWLLGSTCKCAGYVLEGWLQDIPKLAGMDSKSCPLYDTVDSAPPINKVNATSSKARWPMFVLLGIVFDMVLSKSLFKFIWKILPRRE